MKISELIKLLEGVDPNMEAGVTDPHGSIWWPLQEGYLMVACRYRGSKSGDIAINAPVIEVPE